LRVPLAATLADGHVASFFVSLGMETFHTLSTLAHALFPLPPSETSAFNKIRAFSTRRAGLFPFRINVSSRSRSSPLSVTTYFFTKISCRVEAGS
jgi:hypothetical protein